MAVTRVWPVRGKITQVIDYVRNPEKTDAALTDTIGYATNKDKTEKGLYVSGVNCTPEDASAEFVFVKRQFDKEGGIIAYHAYQSFSAGEVTPQQAHAIGKEFAEKAWGNRFQVVVATHLNTGCLHNHFVVNSVSFVDGRRCRQKQWRELSKISDAICKAHDLSVVENARGKRIPLPIYKAEQEGKATRLNLAKAAVDEALARSCNLKELEANLKQKGYLCRFDSNRKYWTIQQRDWERPIRLMRMGEAYSNDKLKERLKAQERKPRLQYLPEKRYRQYNLPVRKDKLKRLGGLRGLYLHYCYLLGYLPRYRN